MQRIFIVNILVVFTLAIAVPVEAAKVLPRFKTSKKQTTKVSPGVTVQPRLRKDKKALMVTFSNIKKAKTISYVLTYQTDGKEEGISSSLNASAGNTVTRELLFGTCSSGVCRYHPNIANMKLEVTIEPVSGKKVKKKYKIKM